MSKLLTKIIITIIAIAFPAAATHAARIYFDPPEITMGPGDSAEIKVKVEVDEACINTVDAKITYPSDYIYIREFTTGDSILSIWVNQPSSQDIEEMNQNNLIEFTGGIPGGYCGRIPGDPGESNIIGRVVFTVPGMIVTDEDRDEVEIRFTDETKVYINDGLGTEAKLTKGYTKVKLADSGQVEDFDFAELIRSDTISPEPFIIELMQDDRLFEGAYHINFATVDKQTGVDHYEILEIKPDQEIGVAKQLKWWEKLFKEEPIAPDWTVGKMPYVLKDQSLNSIVKVKAVDKAGNERMVEYVPPSEIQKEEPSIIQISMIVIIAGGVIITGLLLWLIIWIIKHFKNKSLLRSQEEEDYEEENNSINPDTHDSIE